MQRQAMGGTRKTIVERGHVTPGVRYITKDLICKLTKLTELSQVVTLSLTLAKEGGKKIKFIENLELCRNLQTLNLSCNIIEKIEKLEKLTKLKELNLSYNKISRIENIDALVGLHTLNLTGNNISQIPNWLPKKLKSLQVLRISKNNIQSLHELHKLKQLQDLSVLTVAENPVTKLPHSRLYLVFHIRTVETLDGQPVTWHERTTAQARFAQEELEMLELQLEQRENEVSQLKEALNKSAYEADSSQTKNKTYQDKMKATHEKIKDLNTELQTKDNLLKRKTAELTKACEKHYELEQELAFYKIDHKFEQLAKLPSPDSESIEDGLIGDSPYIGKGRFRQEMLSRQRGQGDFELEEMQRQHEELDRELEGKRQAIEKAQHRLENLNYELASTEDQITLATDELQNLVGAEPSRHLTEDDKQEIRSRLSKKINKVNMLRMEANKIESEMNQTRAEVEHQEMEIGRLRGQLRRMGSKDSLYKQVQKEVADAEVQLELSNQEYNALQQKLEEMLTTITREAADIKKLEQELREGQAAQNDEIREELQGIISGLESYLAHVRHKAEKETVDYSRLLRDREELLHRLADLEQDKEELSKAQAEMSLLKQHINAVEDSLEAQRNINATLKHELDETRMRELEDNDLSDRLHEAGDEINRLKNTLQEYDKQAKMQKDDYERKLQAAQKRLKQMNDLTRQAENKDDELNEAQHQLMELQSANTDLQSRLYQLKEKEKKAAEGSVDPRELRRRLDQLMRGIKSGQGGIESSFPGDKISEVLIPIQEKLKEELDKSMREAERARKAQAKTGAEVEYLRGKLDRTVRRERDRAKRVEEESQALRDELEKTRQKERLHAEMAVQAKMVDEDRELAKLHDELEKLKKELEIERRKKKDQGTFPSRLLEPTPRSESTEMSSIPSSQWSERKHELYDNLNPDEQDLFDELQDEINELRKLLAIRDKKEAAKKAASASQTIGKLRDMISKRRNSTSTQGRKKHKPRSTASRTPLSHGDERLAEAAADLSRAESEIENLHSQLRDKDKQLRAEIRHSDRSQNTITGQHEEIEQLYDVLEEQKAEIITLSKELDRVAKRGPDGPLYDERDIQQLRQGAANVRSTVAQHAPRFRDVGIAPGPYYGPTQTPSGQAAYTHGVTEMPSPGGPPVQPHPGIRHHSQQPRGPHQPVDYVDYAPQQEVTNYLHQPSMQTAAAPGGNAGGYVAPSQYPGHNNYPGANFDLSTGHPMTAYIPSSQLPMVQHAAPSNMTPIAGAGMSALLSVPTTPVVPSSMPVMHSTPTQVESLPMTPIKGILKTTGGSRVDTDDELLCNIPEHHDLEDYIDKLQAKLRSYKARLLEKQKEEMSDEDNRRVLFKDDVERHAVKRLKDELEDRRAELEGLDLAIERQKSDLIAMKEAEKLLRVEREAARTQLKALKFSKQDKAARRRAFINGESDYATLESDFEYEYHPRTHRPRKGYLADEISCLEETLAKRRAELREADELLNDCREDLKDAREEAKSVINQYLEAKSGYSETVQDTEELEKRAKDTGVQLVKAEEQLNLLKQEVQQLQDVKKEQEGLLEDINQVITSRDDEFQKIDARVKDSVLRMQSLEGELGLVQSQQLNNDRIVTDKRKELLQYKGQLDKERKELELLDREMGQGKVELKLLHEAIQKRHSQLENLDKDVEKEINVKRRDVREVENRLRTLKEEEKKMERDMKHKQDKLDEVLTEIDHEEEVLQNLAATTSNQKLHLQNMEEALENAKNNFEILASRIEKLREEEADLRRVSTDLDSKTADLERVSRAAERIQKEVDELMEQRRTLLAGLTKLQDDRAAMEDEQRAAEKRIVQLTRNKGELEESVCTSEARLKQLEADLKDVEADIDDALKERSEAKQELSSLRHRIQDTRSALEAVNRELQDTENKLSLYHENEAEKQRLQEEKIASLEKRVKELGDVITERNEEKEQLAAALNRSGEELQSLRKNTQKEKEDLSQKVQNLEETIQQAQRELTDKSEEFLNLKDKSGKEIMDLEGVAQAHYGRANRLSDELNYLRAEHLELKRQLVSQQEMVDKEKKLEETLQDLRDEIKSEVTSGLQELDKSRNEALDELDQLHDQKSNLEEHLDSLKHNLSLIRLSGSSVSLPHSKPSTDSKEQFLMHQEFLKKQLNQKMNQYAEVIQLQNQQSQDNLRKLHLKLLNLENTLSQNESAVFRPPKDDSTSGSLESPKQSQTTRQLSPTRKSLSPHRYSHSRGIPSPGPSLIPEKGPAS